MNNFTRLDQGAGVVFVGGDSVTVAATGVLLQSVMVSREVTIAGSLAAAAAVVRTTDLVRADRSPHTSAALLNQHVQPLRPADLDSIPAPNNNDDDHEIGLLWLPYFIFTIVLLGLIALSFVRFHCQRGDQYRKRQEELEDKMPIGENVMNGRQGAPPLLPDIPDHLSLFVQFTKQESNTSSPMKVNPYQLSHPRWPPPPVVQCRSNDSDSSFHTSARVPPPRSQKASSVDGLECGRATQLKMKQQKSSSKSLSRPGMVTTSKPPLLFTFNVNGSMVDIRCGDEERSNTFRLTSRRSVAADTLSATSMRGASAASAATYSASGTSASNTGVIVSCALADEEKTRRYYVATTGDVSPQPPPRDAVFYDPGYNTYNLNKKQFYPNNNVVVSGSPAGSYYYVNSVMGQAPQSQLLYERQPQSCGGRTIPSVDEYSCILAQARRPTDIRKNVAGRGGGGWSDNESLLRQNVESS